MRRAAASEAARLAELGERHLAVAAAGAEPPLLALARRDHALADRGRADSPRRPTCRRRSDARSRLRSRSGRRARRSASRGSGALTSAGIRTRPTRSPRPHGHGFDAATSMKRQGNSTAWRARTIVTVPSSSGCRRASSASRENSPSSSRNRTPRCASVTSPGPRRRAPADQPGRRDRVMRGAERAAARASRARRARPQALAIRRTSSASARLRGGRIEGSRRAASDLPAPGGPTTSTLCPPAAAISSAQAQVGLPPEVGQVGKDGLRAVRTPGHARGRTRLVVRAQHRQLGKPGKGNHPCAAGEHCLGGVDGRNRDRLEAAAACGLGDRERSGDRPDRPRRERAPRPGRCARSAQAGADRRRRAARQRSPGRTRGRPSEGRRERGSR